MTIKILLWDKPNYMDVYEKYIADTDYSTKLVVFKIDEEDFPIIHYDEVYDIIVVDISTRKDEKIKYFNILRIKNPSIQLICIGNKSSAAEAWEWKCSDYLLKPVTKQKFESAIKNAIKNIDKERLYYETNKSFLLKEGGRRVFIKYNKIIYFEKIGKKINIVTEKSTYDFYSSFQKLKKEIDMDYFLQCHQGYIVNKYKIKAINNNNNLKLYGIEREIPVSRRYKKRIIDDITNSL